MSNKDSDTVRMEAIGYIRTRPYFQKFSQKQQEDYLQRISKFNFSNWRIKRHYKLFFAEDYFIDERLLRYEGSVKTPTFESLFIIGSALLFLFSIWLLVTNKTYLYSLFNLQMPLSSFVTLIIVFGSLISALDVFVPTSKIQNLDAKLFAGLKSYETGWVRSIKVSLLVHQRYGTDFLDWGINASISILFLLFVLGLRSFPPLSLLALFALFSAYSSFMGSHSKGFGMVPLILVAAYIGQYGIHTFIQNNKMYAACLFVYYQTIASIRELYDTHPKQRFFLYTLIILLGSPWIILKIVSRIIPFLILIPIYGLVRILSLFKPTSLLRFIGLVLVILGYFLDKCLVK